MWGKNDFQWDDYHPNVRFKYLVGGFMSIVQQVEALVDTRNSVLMLRAQRSSRHKNCRIGRLMFDNQHT